MGKASINIDYEEDRGITVNGLPLEYLLETVDALKQCKQILGNTQYCQEMAKPDGIGPKDPIYAAWYWLGGLQHLISVVEKEAELIMSYMKARP